MNRPPLGRLIAFALALILAMGAIVVRLAILQVSRADAYQAIAFDQRVHPVALPAWRGRCTRRTSTPIRRMSWTRSRRRGAWPRRSAGTSTWTSS
jgi:cell division protein FtsI/penicillin-binding protein 2